MNKLGDYFLKTYFIRVLSDPVNVDVGCRPNLGGMTKEELSNLSYGLKKMISCNISKSKSKEENHGYVIFEEVNNGRIITDSITYDTVLARKEFDSLALEVAFKVDRKVDGFKHDLPCVRDGLYRLPYEDCSEYFRMLEIYIMIDNGRRVLHYIESCPEFETYLLNERWNLYSGFDVKSRKVFNRENAYNISDIAFQEISELLYDDKGKSLIKRWSTK